MKVIDTGGSELIVCEYFGQGEDLKYLNCEECGDLLSDHDRGYGTVFYSVGGESVREYVGNGSLICPGYIGEDADRAVKPLQ